VTRQSDEEKSPQQWYLYIIETKNLHFYTGISTNWQRRFKEHSDNKAKSAKALRGKGPLKLKFCCVLDNHSIALKAEYWLKQQSKIKKKDIITGKLPLPFSHDLVDTNDLKA